MQALHQIPRMTLEEAVLAAHLIHNATPHPGVGMSPYCALYRFEPALPGWQELRTDTDVTVEANRKRQAKRVCVIEILQDEQRALMIRPAEQGDWAVFSLGQTQKLAVTKAEGGLTNATWTLPHKVIQVKDNMVVLAPIGDPKSVRVPVAHVRKLVTSWIWDFW
eukprot:Blabericola_migrator_1__6563@NODE_3306_length_1877_cov_6_516022_g2067_i0_p1_GENE_NODE_3306_length_1877_cov_6_516022_g2067_i0NODE_3306_length_1877_cov_6_516022_g2067_i0_p1_ORF_typecomplete_len164_score13_82_NODE_3306_length_1877_cov_6_516022_g2067_i011391630